MKKENPLAFQIAHGLAELRRSRQLSQVELADRLHTKQTVISRIESGATVPSWDFLTRMVQALNAQVNIFFTPLAGREDLSLSTPNETEYICVNCTTKWTSALQRSVLQCPVCHKRQGVPNVEYKKALASFREILREVKKAPPFKKAPPVRSMRRNVPSMLKLIRDSAGGTFPSPELPFSLLFRIYAKAREEQRDNDSKDTLDRGRE
jgi:transcriptional regulator with XRE-family HTH domain